MELLNKIKNNKAKIGVIGLGYVGLRMIINSSSGMPRALWIHEMPFINPG
jgi:hypothetical protein